VTSQDEKGTRRQRGLTRRVNAMALGVALIWRTGSGSGGGSEKKLVELEFELEYEKNGEGRLRKMRLRLDPCSATFQCEILYRLGYFDSAR
jgi:hypothetical protein